MPRASYIQASDGFCAPEVWRGKTNNSQEAASKFLLNIWSLIYLYIYWGWVGVGVGHFVSHFEIQFNST